jgi:hypothetical protein
VTALEIPEELLQRLRDSTGQHWTAADLERIAKPPYRVLYGATRRHSEPQRMHLLYSIPR